MGLLRDLAKKALVRVIGPAEAPRSPPAPPPPARAVTEAKATRDARAAGPPAADAAPAAAAPPATAPAAPTPAAESATSSAGSAGKPDAKPGKAKRAAPEAPVAEAPAPPVPEPVDPPSEARARVKPAELDPAAASSIGDVARPRRRRGHAADDEAAAELLANIEAGAQEVRERMDAGEPVTVLDVREPFETAGGILPGAILIPLGQLPARWREVEGANEIVCYCASGMRSLRAAALLRENGLFNATSMEGGISQWMAVGGRIVRPGG
jgi:rhodanese-related sulfurtransferase